MISASLITFDLLISVPAFAVEKRTVQIYPAHEKQQKVNRSQRKLIFDRSLPNMFSQQL
jgi:hypothetical protein